MPTTHQDTGSTDRKRPVSRPVPPSARPRPEAGADLDWIAFCARYVPGRRPRHDFHAVVDYGAYKEAGESRG